MSDDYKLQGVHFIRLIWCDAAGIRRCRVVPFRRFNNVRELGVGLSNACLFLPSWGDCPPVDPATKPVGEIRLMPGTIHKLPWRMNHAMTLVTMDTAPGKAAWQCCPRSILRRVLDRAESEYGVTLKAGFELEFILLKKPSDKDDGKAAGGAGGLPAPLDASVYCQTSSFDAAAPVLEEMISVLRDLGITIDQVHPESAPGQFELALSCSGAMQAADNVILAKEAICAVAAKHDLVASFLPKLFRNQAGSGMHCHFSLWKGEDNITYTGEGESNTFGGKFLAGILQNLPALMAFTAPSPNSFNRVAPSTWSGAFKCWGVNNREAALRVLHLSEIPDGANVELKTFDATANPHIGLAAAVMAGLLGVAKGASLPEQIDVDPATLPEVELERRGVDRLPSTLEEAIATTKANTELVESLNEGFGSKDYVRAHLAVKQSEWDYFKGLSFDEEVGMLYARY